MKYKSVIQFIFESLMVLPSAALSGVGLLFLIFSFVGTSPPSGTEPFFCVIVLGAIGSFTLTYLIMSKRAFEVISSDQLLLISVGLACGVFASLTSIHYCCSVLLIPLARDVNTFLFIVSAPVFVVLYRFPILLVSYWRNV